MNTRSLGIIGTIRSVNAMGKRIRGFLFPTGTHALPFGTTIAMLEWFGHNGTGWARGRRGRLTADASTSGVSLVIEATPEEFLQACGARTPPLLDLEHRGRREITRWTLSLPFALLGRDERADLRLDDENISHRHAYLQLVSGRLWCVDLGSRTGIHGEGGKIPAGVLHPPESFRIGPYALRLVNGEVATDARSIVPINPLSSEADDMGSLPRIALDFRGGSAREKTWMVDRPLTLVGRAPFCKVRLHSSMVSRVHCALVNTTAGLWVVDLLGREGIYVNGKAVRWAGLEPDDDLQIDQFHVRVRFLAPSQRNLPARRVPDTAAPPAPILPSALRPGNENGALLAGSTYSPLAPTTPAQLGVQALMLPMFAQFAEMQQQMFDQFQQSLVLMAQMLGGLQREQMQMIRQELDQLRDVTRELQEVQAEWSQQTATAPPQLLRAEETTERQEERETQGRKEEETKPRREDELGATSGAAKESPTPASPDVHLWLAQRLATLQQDRQTRWQKILGMLSGK